MSGLLTTNNVIACVTSHKYTLSFSSSVQPTLHVCYSYYGIIFVYFSEQMMGSETRDDAPEATHPWDLYLPRGQTTLRFHRIVSCALGSHVK